MKNINLPWGLLIGVGFSACYLVFTFALSLFLNQIDARICSLIITICCTVGGMMKAKSKIK